MKQFLWVFCLLLGVGGLLAAESNLFVAVGYGGRRMSSRDGFKWQSDTERSSKAADDDNVLFAVAHGRERFVAVGGATKVGHILNTADGKEWTEPFTFRSRVATLAFGNDRFVGARGNEFVYSLDGIHWTNGAKTEFKGGMHPRKSAFGNGLFVTVGDCDPSGKPRTRFRSVTRDGTSLIHFTTNRPPEQAIAFGAGRFVVVGKDGLRESSTNGVMWEHQQMEPGENLGSIVWDGNRFLAGGGKMAWSSPDGIHWKREAKRIPCTLLYAKNGLYLGASWGGNLYASTNGLDWTKTLSGPGNSIEAIAALEP